ncbi:MAG: type 3 dihydrofolate reductase [Terrimicrobiaceae bacterium]
MIAIAAMTSSRVIGKDGQLPWHLPEDLKFFKRTTHGHVVLMGRTTYDSIGRPLPGRDNWVLTRGPSIPGVFTIRSTAAIPKPPEGKKIYLIGGARAYESLLSRCSEVILTRLRSDFPGDTFFPAFEQDFLLHEVLMETTDFQIERWLRAR